MINKYKKIIGGIIGFVFILFAIWYFFNIVVYIMISIVLSLMAQPLVAFIDSLHFRKHKIPHILSVVTGMIALISAFLLFFLIVTPLITEQLKSLSQISITTIEEGLGQYIISLEYSLKDFGLISEDTDLKSMILNEVTSFFSKIKISGFVSNIFDFIKNAFIGIFAVMFITFFILRDNKIVYRALFLIIPENFHDETQRILKSSKNLLSRYFVGLIIEVILVGGSIALALWLLNIENAFIIGFIGGLLNVIPYVGPLIGMSIGLLLGITSSLPMDVNIELMPIIYKIAFTFLIIKMIDDFVFQPIIYSKSVKAHPLEIFLIIFIGGNIAGILGMMIAIPTYTFVRIVAREFFINNRLVKRLTESLNDVEEK